jgi:DnaJ-class molecular chaperone
MDGRTYMILGVSRAESPGGIRAAYRDLARKLHPDVAGEQATHAFQEVSEAYDVLSDPERRRQYNHELERAEGEDVRPVRPAIRTPIMHQPIGIFDSSQSIRPSFEAMRDPCWSCQQRGVTESEQVVRFGIPPLVRSGSIFEMPLQGLGIHNFYLRLHVFVE